jgi:hypothetical protein
LKNKSLRVGRGVIIYPYIYEKTWFFNKNNKLTTVLAVSNSVSKHKIYMWNSEIETNPETEKQSLTVYYDPVKDDFDRQIELAMAYHGIAEGEMLIIALPKLYEN